MMAETPMNITQDATRDGEADAPEAPTAATSAVDDWRLEDAVERALNDLREEGMGKGSWLWKGSTL